MSTLQAAKRVLDPLRPRLRPSFLIIGAQKAGTSAVYDMIATHPAALTPPVKELMFFSRADEYARGPRHYFGRFPIVPLRGGRRFTFEASVGYLSDPDAPERIHRHLPEVNLAAILREPVSRAFSAWNMFRQFEGHPQFAHLHDPRPFEQAVRDEMGGAPVHRAHRYLANGRYAPQLQRYFDRFGRDRVQLFRYPDLRTDPRSVVDGILRTIGEGADALDPAVFSKQANTRPYGHALEPALREELHAWCAPWQQELDALLGRSFPL